MQRASRKTQFSFAVVSSLLWNLEACAFFSVNAYGLQTLHYAHTHLSIHHKCIQTWLHSALTNQLACRQLQICVGAHMQFLSSSLLFLTNKLMHAQTLTTSSWSLCVHLSAHGNAFLSLPLTLSIPLFPFFPALPLSVWIIHSSTGVESAHKVEDTMNDLRMFQLDRTRGSVSNCGSCRFA